LKAFYQTEEISVSYVQRSGSEKWLNEVKPRLFSLLQSLRFVRELCHDTYTWNRTPSKFYCLMLARSCCGYIVTRHGGATNFVSSGPSSFWPVSLVVIIGMWSATWNSILLQLLHCTQLFLFIPFYPTVVNKLLKKYRHIYN